MPLHRTASSDALTTFATDILHDRDISWCAAGLLVYLLSFPDGVDVSVDSLIAQRGGRRADVAAGLSELEAAGYLRRVTRGSGDLGGSHAEVRYEVSDVRPE